MRRIALALAFGALMTLLLFWAIDQADKAIPPPIPTPLAQPTMIVVAPSTGVMDFGEPVRHDAAPILPQGTPETSGRRDSRVDARSPASTAARAAAFTSAPATLAAEALLLTATPSDVPDIVSAPVGDAARAMPRTDRSTADIASSSSASHPPHSSGSHPTSRSVVGSSSASSGARDGTASSGTSRVGRDVPPAPAVQGVSRAALSKSNREPNYPERIRARGGEGSVSVRVFIDSLGEVASVEVLGASGDPGLRSHVVESLRSWTFEPAIDRGTPASSILLRKFVFRLDDP